MRFQDTSGGTTSNGVGVKFPNYMQNPTAGQTRTAGGGNQTQLGWADKNRAQLSDMLGTSGFTGADGRLDLGKTTSALKSFCV